MTWRSTGFPAADAQDDFLRVRRRQLLTRMGQRLRLAPGDAGTALSYDHVIKGLGLLAEHAEGLRSIPLDAIVGSVDKSGDYDRKFRPRSDLLRERWQRIAVAQRRGESVPPIDVYRVGDLYFVKDGHHRVSVARALGRRTIDAYVTSVRTAAPAAGLTAREGRRVDVGLRLRDRLRARRGIAERLRRPR